MGSIARKSFTPILGLAMGLSVGLAAGDAHAAFSLKGKTVTFLVGYGSGGDTDALMRVLGKYMAPNLPGDPTIVYRNMPGAGSVKAMNYFASTKPNGETVMAGAGGGVRPDTLRRKAVRYDPRKWVMIGGFPALGGVMMIRKDAMSRFLDKSKPPLIMTGITGGRSASQMAVWGPAFLGWNLRWVVGYKGTGAMQLAFERGEAQASASYFINVLNEVKKGGYANFVAQVGIFRDGKFRPHPAFPDVPIFSDMVRPKLKGNPQAQAAFKAFEESVKVSKWYGLAPGTPESISEVYIAAFNKTIAQKDFHAAAVKVISDAYTTTNAAETQDMIDGLASVTDASLDYIYKLRNKVGIPVAGTLKKKR